MVISVDIDKFTIMKTLMDQGSSVDILYWKTLKHMRLAEEEMKSYDDHVVGFSGERVALEDMSSFIPPSARERRPGQLKFGIW